MKNSKIERKRNQNQNLNYKDENPWLSKQKQIQKQEEQEQEQELDHLQKNESQAKIKEMELQLNMLKDTFVPNYDTTKNQKLRKWDGFSYELQNVLNQRLEAKDKQLKLIEWKLISTRNQFEETKLQMRCEINKLKQDLIEANKLNKLQQTELKKISQKKLLLEENNTFKQQQQEKTLQSKIYNLNLTNEELKNSKVLETSTKKQTTHKNKEALELNNQTESLKTNKMKTKQKNILLKNSLKTKIFEIDEIKLNCQKETQKMEEINLDYQKIQKENDLISQQNVKFKNNISSLLNKLKKKQKENQDLQSQLEKNDDTILKLEFEKQEINHYLAKTHDQYKQIEEINQKNTEKMKALQSSFELKNKQISNLYKKLDLVNKTILGRETNTFKLESDNRRVEEQLRGELELIKNENIRMKRQLTEAEFKNKELLIQFAKKEKKNKRLKNNLKDLELRINQNVITLNKYEFELKEKNLKNYEKKVQLKNLKNVIANLKLQLDEEKNKKNSYQKKYLQTKDQFYDNLRSIQRNLNEKKKKITELLTNIDDLNNEKDSQLSKIEKLNQNLFDEREIRHNASHFIQEYFAQFSKTIEKTKYNSLKEYLVLTNSLPVSSTNENHSSDRVDNKKNDSESNPDPKAWLITTERQLYDLQRFFKNTVYKLKKVEIRNSLLKEACLNQLTTEQLSTIKDQLYRTQEEQLNEKNIILLEKDQQINDLNKNYSSIITKNRILIAKVNNLQSKLFGNTEKTKKSTTKKYNTGIYKQHNMKRKQLTMINENEFRKKNYLDHKYNNDNVLDKYFEQEKISRPLPTKNRNLLKMELNNK
ncbi:hypothetical protein M0813_11380 [Anaeramoeba flamelloides]|uniref:Uncharacterized protein n=1 Tax=Anaeramoeba flamelloides TaxID=1746091 RepID=A0ABQ8ZF57_9EUKA|nr:hypothetical protein M0813_11380 [Anaeramoeba flamelloides]